MPTDGRASTAQAANVPLWPRAPLFIFRYVSLSVRRGVSDFDQDRAVGVVLAVAKPSERVSYGRAMMSDLLQRRHHEFTSDNLADPPAYDVGAADNDSLQTC